MQHLSPGGHDEEIVFELVRTTSTDFVDEGIFWAWKFARPFIVQRKLRVEFDF